jgi:hypothetical protein
MGSTTIRRIKHQLEQYDQMLKEQHYYFKRNRNLILKDEGKRKTMADPNKFKSVSVPIDTYKKLNYLADGKFLDAQLTISKTIEALASRAAKKLGYKNGKAKD